MYVQHAEVEVNQAVTAGHYENSLPLSASWLSVPLLCITLASSPSGWGASATSGAARASHADGGPALVLQKHTKPQVDNSF